EPFSGLKREPVYELRFGSATLAGDAVPTGAGPAVSRGVRSMLGTKTRRTLGNLFDWVSRKAFPKWYNIRVCSTEGLWDPYFTEAEQWMQESWERYIWPVIKGYRFDTVLELAPGAGRNTEKLAQLAKVLHAVDLNDYALNRLRERFRSYTGTCKLHFHRNVEADLAKINDGTITLIYCCA